MALSNKIFNPNDYLTNSSDEEDEKEKNPVSFSSFNPDAYINNTVQEVPVDNSEPVDTTPVDSAVVDSSIPENHKRYDYAFDTAAKKYNIPKELFYSFLPVENNDANPEAAGPLIENPKSVHYGDRALGLFQIMPKTAQMLNEKSGQQRDPLNPEDSADLFAQHIREALDRYGEENIEDAVVDFFSGPQGVELYRNGKGDTANDGNLNINEYAQKVVDNFKRLSGNIPSSEQNAGNSSELTPFNPDGYLSPGESVEKKPGWFSGLFPMMRSKEDNIAAEKNPNVGDNEMFASDRTAIGSDIMDPEISEKYKTMAEREGVASAGIKQALETALFVKNPAADARMQENPVSTTVGTIAGVVGPAIAGGAGVSKAAAELPALVRLVSAGKWGKVAHGAIVRGCTAAANWLARDGGDQILSNDPEIKKNAIMNLTSSLAGAVVSPLPETFAPKGAVQLVLQPAIDALVETGVMASFGKNAWDKENIVNTLSQVVMSALFSANDLKKVGGDQNVSTEKMQTTETPVNTDIPAFMRKGTDLKQVDENIAAPGKPVQGWPVADEGYLMGQFPKMGEEDVQSFLKSRSTDEIEAIKDKARFFAKKASGDKLDIGNISAEDAISMLDRARKRLPFALKGITIDPKDVPDDVIERATDFAAFFTGSKPKKDVVLRDMSIKVEEKPAFEIPNIGKIDIDNFLSRLTPDGEAELVDRAKFIVKKISDEKVDVKTISSEDAARMLERAQKKLPFSIKGITIDPAELSDDIINRATDFADFFTGQNKKKDINFRSEDDEIAYTSKGPLKDDELPGFLREIENVGTETSRATQIEQSGSAGKSDSDRAEIDAITAKLPEDLDPRTADEFDLRIRAGLNDDEISKLKGEIDALEEERIAYETDQLKQIAETTGEMTSQKQEVSASSLLADIRKDIDAASLDPATRKDIDRYISGKSSDISVFSMDNLRKILSPRISTMNSEKVDLGGDYGKQQGEWDAEELIRFVQENSKASPLYGKKIGPRVKSNNPDDMFSDQTGDLFGRSAEQQKIAEFQMNRDAERQKKQMKNPLKGTIFDLEQREADATVQEDLFSKQGGLSANQQKLKRYRNDAIKNKLDEISKGSMVGGQLESFTGGTATTGNKYAGSINLERIDTGSHIKKLVEDVFEHYIKNANDSETKPMTKEETQELANSLGWDQTDVLKRKKGQVWNHAEGKAARDINAASSERLYSIVENMQKKAVDGTLTENDRIAMMREYYLHAAVQAEVNNNASQSGRALRSHGYLTNTAVAKGRIKTLKSIMEEAGDDPKKAGYIFEKLMSIDTKDPAKFNRFMHKSALAKTVDGVYEAYLNFLFSPATQAVNVSSNAIASAYRTGIEKPAAALMDTGRALLTGKSRERYLRETPQEIVGMVGGLKDALKVFAKTWVTEQPSGPVRPNGEVFHEPAIPGMLGQVIRVHTRTLAAADEFFKTVIYRGEIQARLYRKARNKGLKGDEIGKFITENINDPDEVTKQAAMTEANYRTFTAPMGKFGNWILKGRNDIPALKWILPFVRVPINVAKFALERAPISGQLIATKRILPKWKEGKISKGEIADEVAKSMVGSALSLLVVGLAKSGVITGGGPKEQNKREELYNDGWHPYSIKIGDKSFAYGRLEPIASLIGIAADFAEMGLENTNEDTVYEIVKNMAFSYSKNVTSKTFLTALSNFIDAVSDPTQYGDGWITKMGSALVPNSLSAIQKAIDPTLRENKTLGQSLLSKTPFLGSSLFPKRKWTGEIIQSQSTGLEAFISPVVVSEESNDPVFKEIRRIGANIGKPGKTITFEGVEGTKLTDKEYDHYQQIAGQKAKMMVESLIETSYYKSLPDEEKVKEIRDTVEKARKRVRYKLEQYMKKERK
jgi:hypothetical protein